jgi:hypothetical protein
MVHLTEILLFAVVGTVWWRWLMPANGLNLQRMPVYYYDLAERTRKHKNTIIPEPAAY